jgi:Flp pilus assembly protein TadG
MLILSRPLHWRPRLGTAVSFLSRDDRGAQLVEFAVALPLLVLFVVGIFDFSNAFTFKQKLTNIARDAARVAAGDPSNDVASQPVPVSVIDAFQVVDNYLASNNISDCSVGTTPSKVGLTFTYTGTGASCPAGGFTLIINRGYYFAAAAATQPATVNCQPLAPPATAIIGTCVSIQYAYAWRFGNVASLLGRSTLLPSTITAVSVAMNEN